VSGELLWWLNLLIGVGVFTLLAVSLNLINGYAGMFHLGHHGFWAMGAYAAAWLTIVLLPSGRFLAEHDANHDGEVARAEYADETRFDDMDEDADGTLSKGELEQALDHRVDLYLLSLAFAMAVAAVGGLVIGIPCLRLRGDYLAIATLGFGEIVRIAIQNSDPATLGGSLGLHVPRVLMTVDRETKGDFRLVTLGIVVAFCVLATWGIRNFIRSAQGRRLLAVAQDETAAGLLGINPTHSKVLAFVIGSAIAGLAGGLFAHYEGTITPLDFNFMEMVKMFLIIVLGGMGSLSGCVVGAFLVIGTERLLARSPGLISEWWQVEYPLLLAIMIIFRPQGLFGRREITDFFRLWRGRRAEA